MATHGNSMVAFMGEKVVWWLGCQTPSGESSGLKPWIGIGIEKG